MTRLTSVAKDSHWEMKTPFGRRKMIFVRIALLRKAEGYSTNVIVEDAEK